MLELDEVFNIVHMPGIINPNWPLCHEAAAVSMGWTQGEILDGELPVDLDGRPYEDDEPYVPGFEGETRPPNCRACRAQAHA